MASLEQSVDTQSASDFSWLSDDSLTQNGINELELVQWPRYNELNLTPTQKNSKLQTATAKSKASGKAWRLSSLHYCWMTFFALVVIVASSLGRSSKTPSIVNEWLANLQKINQDELLKKGTIPSVRTLTCPTQIKDPIKNLIMKSYTGRREFSNVVPKGISYFSHDLKPIQTILPNECLKDRDMALYSAKSDAGQTFLAKLLNVPDRKLKKYSRELEVASKVYKHNSADYVFNDYGLIMPIAAATVPPAFEPWRKGDCSCYFYQQNENEKTGVLNIRDVINMENDVKEFLAKRIILSVLRAHDLGLVHNNITEDNFFITTTGNVLLGGFNYAAEIGEQITLTQISSNSDLETKIQYDYAINKTMVANPKVDLFALGKVIYKLFGGKNLNTGGNLRGEELLMWIKLNDKEPRFELPGASTKLKELTQQLLRPRRDGRSGSKAIWEAYEDFLTS